MNVNPGTTTIKDVVVEDYRTAAVFQNYGLDFCCGGGATIERACRKKGIDTAELLADLNKVLTTSGTDQPHPAAWDADFLADYIEQNHHRYVRSVIPAIREHAEKVARVHGAFRPEVIEIAQLFTEVADELELHMRKEEQILFPAVKELTQFIRQGRVPASSGTVSIVIQGMEAEHEKAGDQMKDIRRLSNDYTPPSDACMTYRVLYKELEDFERDLHRHVHLENNILFPKAMLLEIQPAQAESACTWSGPVEG